MSITAAKIQAEVGADTGGFDRGMAHADSTIRKAPGKWATALKVGAGAGLAVAGAFVVRGLVGAIKGGLDSLQQEGVVVAQTNATIRSTGAAAHVTAQQIRELSTALETKSGFDDKAIQSGANLLLTFTNIKNAAGAGNNIFDQSTEVLTNMARAMGTDVTSGAIKLGRALQDPLKGITALTRVGVMFTAQQKAEILAAVGTGDALKNLKDAGISLTKSQTALIKSYGPAVDTIAAAEEAHVKLTKAQRKLFNGMDDGTGIIRAQKVILRELRKEFGQSNAEFMKTDAGKALLFADAVEGVEQKLAGALLPTLTEVRVALTAFLSDPATMGQAAALGESIGAIFSTGNLKTAASLMTTAAGAIGTVIKLFSALPPQVQALAVGALTLEKITGIGPIDIVKSAFGGLDLFNRGGTPANPLFVADVTGGIGAGAGGGKGLLGKLTSAPVLLGGAALVASLTAVWEGKIMPGLQEQAGANIDATTKLLTTGTLAELQGALAGLEGMPGKLDPLQRALYDLNASGIKTHTESLEQAIRDEIASRKARETGQTKNYADPRNRPVGEHAGPLALPGAAGVLQRAVAKGLTPSDTAVARTLARNATRAEQRADVRAANAATATRMIAIAQAIGAANIVTAIHGIKIPGVTNTTIVNRPVGEHADLEPRRPGPRITAPTRPPQPPGQPFEPGWAAGVLGMTRGRTRLGIAGEAGGEFVAILRNPRPIMGGAAAAAAARASESKSYAELRSHVLNPNLNKLRPTPVILSPRAVPNAVRLTDLYGPTSPRNGRAVAS